MTFGVQMQRVYARDERGLWHLTERTYPASADTACGEHLACTVFVAGAGWPYGVVSQYEMRPELCRCVPVINPLSPETRPRR